MCPKVSVQFKMSFTFHLKTQQVSVLLFKTDFWRKTSKVASKFEEERQVLYKVVALSHEDKWYVC